MLASVFTTALLAGSAFALPSTKAAAAAPTCMEKGGSVKEWTVHDFSYHASITFTTPAHQIAKGNLKFTLSNPVLPYKVDCAAESLSYNGAFFAGNTYDCVVPKKYADGDEVSFSYDSESGKLAINQTWSCRKEGGRFMAEGGKKIKLDCDYKTTYQNKHWKVGEDYSRSETTCKKVTTKVPVKTISAVL